MFSYIDSHFHILHMEKKGLDPVSILKDITSQGFTGGIDVGTHPSDIPIRQELLAPFDGIYLAGGIHPSMIQFEPADSLLSDFDRIIQAGKNGTIQAVGECGIDLYRAPETLFLQQQLFIRHLEAAEELVLPVIIHNRRADTHILEILKNHAPSRGGIMHCFSSSLKFADAVQELGFHISFAGNITYPSNTQLQEIVPRVARDRLLFETDSPYLAPHPYRGKPNHPGLIPHTYQWAAAYLQEDVSVLAQQVAETMHRLFSPIP